MKGCFLTSSIDVLGARKGTAMVLSASHKPTLRQLSMMTAIGAAFRLRREFAARRARQTQHPKHHHQQQTHHEQQQHQQHRNHCSQRRSPDINATAKGASFGTTTSATRVCVYSGVGKNLEALRVVRARWIPAVVAVVVVAAVVAPVVGALSPAINTFQVGAPAAVSAAA